MRNYDDWTKARCGERTGHGHIAVQAVRRKKGVSSSGCYVWPEGSYGEGLQVQK